jgi:hypothetical protein
VSENNKGYQPFQFVCALHETVETAKLEYLVLESNFTLLLKHMRQLAGPVL